jgi:spermidine/putrescine transport system ATP-binding protein
MRRADLTVSDVVRRFGALAAVDGVSFDVARGEFFSILGPSGCGKTTLMRMIAGFEEPDAGDIAIGGNSVLGLAPERRPVNMVFQNLALFPNMGVGANVAYGLACRGIARADAEARARRMLERVGLAGFEGRDVRQLSGGQRQRVALARCLVLEPTLLLLDEPLGALDLKLREHMKIELKRLQAEFGTTFVYITHDQSEALVMSDRVAVMARGRFVQVGTPQALYRDPADAFVAGFVGAANRWDGGYVATGDGRARLRLADGTEFVGRDGSGTAATAGACFVRPEAVLLAVAPAGLGALENRFAGTVAALLFDGANSTLLVRAAGGAFEVRAALPQSGPLAAATRGTAVHFGWAADDSRIFPI